MDRQCDERTRVWLSLIGDSLAFSQIKSQKRQDAASDAVFPVVCEIIPDCVFNMRDPIIVGVQIKDGILKLGTPLCVPTKEVCFAIACDCATQLLIHVLFSQFILLGRVTSIEDNHVPKEKAKKDDKVSIRIELDNKFDSQPCYGRHFDLKNQLVSKVSLSRSNGLASTQTLADFLKLCFSGFAAFD